MAKILVFDLDTRVASALKSALASLGHDAAVASDGYSVLPLAEQNRPVLFVLDHKPPEADGVEIMQRLRAKPEFAAVPVIFATFVSKMELEMLLMDAPAVTHLEKPIDGIALRTAVEAYLPSATPAPKPAAAPPSKPAFTGEPDLDGSRDGVIDLD